MKSRWSRVRWLVWLMLIGLLAACSQTGPQAPEEEIATQASFPVYRLVSNGVNAEQVTQLLRLLGAEAVIAEADSSVPISFMDTKQFMAVPSKVVGTGKSREGEGATVLESFDLSALRRTRPLSSVEALGVVQSALAEVGMSPDKVLGSVLATPFARYSRAEAVDAKGTTLFKVNLDTHVMFNLKLNLGAQVPLLGPGAKVKIVLNPQGRLTQFYYGLYGLEPVGQVSVLSKVKAVSLCTDVLTGGAGGLGPSKVTARLVYYVPDASGALNKIDIAPSYVCSANASVSGAPLRQVLISAVTGKPLYTGSLAPGRDTALFAPLSIPRVDVGVEYIGVSQGLGGSMANANGFANTMTANGIPVQFNWGDFAAWESDFKDRSKGGNDAAWVDDVDMVFYTGHANGNGFTFPGNNQDGFLNYTEAAWGNRDLEWLVLAACGPLQDVSSGLTWQQRWGPAFKGLHQLLAYTTVSLDNTDEGRLMATYLMGINLGWFKLEPMMVRQAWVSTATAVQPSSVNWAYMVPVSSSGYSNLNDYFWGKGPTSGDITAPVSFLRFVGPS